jgi:AraC-like DNA-binding protein
MTDASLLALDWALRGGTVALTVLTTMALLRALPAVVSARLGALFAIGAAAYAVVSASGFHGGGVPWQIPLLAVAAGNNTVFWLFASALFDDTFRLRWWHGAIWLVFVVLGTFDCFFPSLPLGLALTSSSLVFAGLAIARTLTTWRPDLVERRRRLRLFIVGASALYIGVIALLQLAGAPAGHETGAPNIAASLSLLAIAGIAAGSLLRLSPDQSLFVANPMRPARPAPDAEPVDKELLAALERSMTVDKVHRQEGLTIGGLAEKLGVPEYRLRRLINQALGYRNFNSFLNDHRIAEVKAALLDPTQVEVPVLILALDAGFSSLGPFNRAFKAETGMTPSQFKRLGGKNPPIPESASHLPTSARRISPAP